MKENKRLHIAIRIRLFALKYGIYLVYASLIVVLFCIEVTPTNTPLLKPLDIHYDWGKSFYPAIALFIIFSKFFFDFLLDKNGTKDKMISDLESSMKDLSAKAEVVKFLNENPRLLEVEESIHKKVISGLEESLLQRLERRFRQETKFEHMNKCLAEELRPLINNTEKYLDKIQRNSIVNLFIGVLGTTISIATLISAIFAEPDSNEISVFLIHFLPRFTFAVFVQLFAFFFLRLYKNNLEDAKYFQNELTNLAAKTASIKITALLDGTDKLYEMLKQLSSIERNFKLAKDESTIGIEKAKLENEIDRSIIEQFKDLLKKADLKK